ncbi:hypothetical protein ABB37_09010 [Leptomonas pyrrhocoris]|uniref:SET domain-containing protein n=1 Tax=Leptomonas pyrrhocoris TaxID=157538 RepID=A0A0N0DRM7_LEPPY|nr:hypothetical protein ABB37_09010 [Leptomonas pyrrhocoris]KPA74684.1 hypothetical protein ABB37_09010 [Leptomonas pyrrhocoris]|eukprot:XP_015653123.1 hypothetical protein ABB37_09010 [Leptomonas pyrrhocoris]
MKYDRTSSSPRMAVEETHDDVKRRGRRVVATTALQPGDAIFATPPDLAVLYSPFARHICARCLVAEVAPEDAGGGGGKVQRSQRRKRRSPLNSAPGARGLLANHASATAAATSASSSLPSSALMCGTTNPTLSTTHSALVHPHNAYICPNCDQFVLCAACVAQLVLEVELLAAAAADEDPACATMVRPVITVMSDEKAVLLQHPLLRAHTISCAWYTALPESIRAPGNDTDFLRFCLDYGARVQLGDTAMVAALGKLDTNAAVQSKEAHHLCEVFARDRVVATFGPHKTPATGTTTTTTTATAAAAVAATTALATHSITRSKHEGVLTASPIATLSSADTSDPLVERNASRLSGKAPLLEAPVFPPPYPVPWTELRDVLLRTRCNSLGFPFSSCETMGWSLQETVCMLNHSCAPNAAVVMLYDADDEQRRRTAHGADDNPQDAAAAAEVVTSTRVQHLHGLRKAQRLSTARPVEGDATATAVGGSSSNSGSGGRRRNLNSYRAIAVSSPSPFSTSFTESLEGWIGIQATRPIAAGEEITVSYIDLEMYGDDVQARSRHLLEQYRFLCTCELCVRQRGRKV